jgi:RNA polymerase sigma-70 factor (ECF subfamily)
MQGTRLIEPASNKVCEPLDAGPQGLGAAADGECIARCLAGDPSAFAVLVERYQTRLYGALVHLTGSPENAADAAQDTFVQAYTKLDTFRQDSQFYTWLYRIAFNLAMSGRRRRRPITGTSDDAAQLAAAATDHSPAPDEQMMTRERVGLVQQAIAALADDHRTIVVLREIEGCDYQQISDILDIPVGTVRSRLFRARAQLKELLAGVFGDDDLEPGDHDRPAS